jgi:hypothetical protein
VSVRDPDAPGGDCVHWGIIDIPSTLTGLEEGIGFSSALPAGAWETLNYKGSPGYTGPCPPAAHDPHHYHFRLYALPKAMGARPKTPLTDIDDDLEAMALGVAELVGTFDR